MPSFKKTKFHPVIAQENKKRKLPSFKLSLLSLAVMSCTTSVMAQSNDDEDAKPVERTVQQYLPANKQNDDNTSDDDVEYISVTGQRQSLQDAIDLKRAGDTIGDSIVLDEAGKVPSTSLLEILERTPGVTMNRIRAGAEGSPDG